MRKRRCSLRHDADENMWNSKRSGLYYCCAVLSEVKLAPGGGQLSDITLMYISVIVYLTGRRCLVLMSRGRVSRSRQHTTRVYAPEQCS